MSVCRKCGHNAVNKKIICKECGLTFHVGCLPRFVIARGCKLCCIKTFREFSQPEPVVINDRQGGNSDRAAFFDNARNLDSNSSFDISNSSDISNSTIAINTLNASLLPDQSQNQRCMQAPSPQLTNMALPPDWDAMSLDQKLAQVYVTAASGANAVNALSVKTDALNSKIDTLTAKVESQEIYIKELESENRQLHGEVANLKERQSKAGRANAEIKVTGIPRACQLTPADLTRAIFTKLNVAGDLSDIFDIREMNPKPLQAEAASMNGNSAQSQYFSYVIQFKSLCVRDRVLRAKRSFGPLTLGVIYANGGDGRIEMYEMLSPYVHNLRLAAKTRARVTGYKFVWVRDGDVLTRKDENSDIINIVTNRDLERIS